MIKSVELHNWKGLRELKLSFSPGINFITGPNGIGKSSVLESICIALTGKSPSESGDIDITDYIRKGSESAIIRVEFCLRNKTFYVNRTISLRGRERCSIFNFDGEEIFTGGWKVVTNYMQRIFDIRALLFNRIIFMSEGDVYRTIYEPPGKALMVEIDRALGIAQLRNLRNNLAHLSKEMRQDEEEYRGILEMTQLTDDDIEQLKRETGKLGDLEKTRDLTRKNLGQLEEKLWRIRGQLTVEEKLLADLNMISSEKKQLAKDRKAKEKLERRLKNVLVKIKVNSRKRIKAETEIAEIEKVQEIIQDMGKSEKLKLECPVCKRPMSKHRARELANEVSNRINILRDAVRDATKQLERNQAIGDQIESELSRIRDREIRLKTLEERLSEVPIETHEVTERIENLTEEAQRLEERIGDTNQNLRNIENEIGNLRERIGALRAMDQRDTLEVARTQKKLILVSKGQYLSQFLIRGIENALTKQRDSQLEEKFYRYLSDVWNSFKGEEGWKIRLTQNGVPNVELRNQEFGFPMLSGGEKTALLVITRTILSKLLAKDIGFLLLDEPLEHLDSRNRRSLLQFLLDTYTEGIVNQLIVTTTEEHLLRIFTGSKDVRIIPLGMYIK